MTELKEISPSMRAYHELADIRKRIGEIMDELQDDMPERKASKSFEFRNPVTGKTVTINGGR